jgi:hypothetical protein
MAKSELKFGTELRRIFTLLTEFDSSRGTIRMLNIKARLILISLVQRELLRLEMSASQKEELIRNGVISKKYLDSLVEISDDHLLQSTMESEGLDGDGI